MDNFLLDYSDIKKKRNSIFGIASICAGFIGTGTFVVMVVLVFKVIDNNPSDTTFAVIGLMAIFCVLMNIIGLIIGVWGLFERDRKRWQPILGIISNFLVLLIIIFVFILGLISN